VVRFTTPPSAQLSYRIMVRYTWNLVLRISVRRKKNP